MDSMEVDGTAAAPKASATATAAADSKLAAKPVSNAEPQATDDDDDDAPETDVVVSQPAAEAAEETGPRAASNGGASANASAEPSPSPSSSPSPSPSPEPDLEAEPPAAEKLPPATEKSKAAEKSAGAGKPPAAVEKPPAGGKPPATEKPSATGNPTTAAAVKPPPAPPAAAVEKPAPAGKGRRGSAPAAAEGEGLPLSLQRKQRQRRPPAGWDMDSEMMVPSKRPKSEPAAEASPPASASTAVNGSTAVAAGGGGGGGSMSPLSVNGIPYGTLFFKAQGRKSNLLLAFDGSFLRPALYRDTTPAAELLPLTEEDAAEEGPTDEIKCMGFARQDGSGTAAGMQLATLAEVMAHFRTVLDPSSATYGKPSGPVVYVIITCDKSRGWMSYEIDVNGNICPKVVYEAESGALVPTTPAQFEASVAQSSAKKWRHSFKAPGGFLKMGPRQGAFTPPTVLDVLNCVKDLLGVSPAISLPADKPLTQQQRRAAAAAAAAGGGTASRGGTPGANGSTSVKQEQRRERDRDREREREREREKARQEQAAAAAAATTAVTGGEVPAVVPAAPAANGTGNAGAQSHPEQNRQAALTLIQQLGLGSVVRPVESPVAAAGDASKPHATNAGTAAAGRTSSLTIRLPTRAAQAAAAVAATRGSTANGARGGGAVAPSAGSLPVAAAGGALAAPATATSAAAGGGGGGISDAQLQSAAVLASTLVQHLALPLAPDVSALGLTGPGLTAAEAQAIQLVCTSVKGPDLAVAVKGIMDSLAGRPVPPTAIAAPAAAALALLALPPGALASPGGVTFGASPIVGGLPPSHQPMAMSLAAAPPTAAAANPPAADTAAATAVRPADAAAPAVVAAKEGDGTESGAGSAAPGAATTSPAAAPAAAAGVDDTPMEDAVPAATPSEPCAKEPKSEKPLNPTEKEDLEQKEPQQAKSAAEKSDAKDEDARQGEDAERVRGKEGPASSVDADMQEAKTASPEADSATHDVAKA